MQVIQKIAKQIKFLLHRSLISGSSDPGLGNRLRCSRNTKSGRVIASKGTSDSVISAFETICDQRGASERLSPVTTGAKERVEKVLLQNHTSTHSRITYISTQRRIRLAGSVALLLFLTLTAFALHPVSVETSFAEATANPATTTLTVETSGNAAVLDITPSSATGTFSSSDTSGTSLDFNVSTDNITGYNLGISHGSSTTPAPLVNENLPSGSATNDSNSLSSLPAGTSSQTPILILQLMSATTAISQAS